MIRRAVGTGFILLWLSGAIGSAASAAVPPLPLGAEFQVNLTTQSHQFEASVAAFGDGGFVVVWSSYLQDGASYGVFGQRWSSTGARVGAEFQVNSYTPSQQRLADVATDSEGDFVVVWASALQDGNVFGVFGQRFTSAGSRQGVEFQVADLTLGDQTAPVVGMDAAGNFVVVWHSISDPDGSNYGVFAKRFDSTGAPLGVQFQVNLQTNEAQKRPAIAMNPAGDFVVAWTDAFIGNGDVVARRFDSAGTPVGGELVVNAATVNYQGPPGVGLDSIGGFAVVWQSDGDGSGSGVFGRRLNAFGVGLPFDTQINTYATGSQSGGRVSMDPAGEFVVVWHDPGLDGSGLGIFGLGFDQLGVPQGGVFQVNTYIPGNQQTPDVALAPDGSFVVVWAAFHDGDTIGVFGQRFASPVAPSSIDIDGNDLADPLTDGLLVIRFLFGFRGGTLINGAVGPGCTRCTAAEIEIFIARLLPGTLD